MSFPDKPAAQLLGSNGTYPPQHQSHITGLPLRDTAGGLGLRCGSPRHTFTCLDTYSPISHLPSSPCTPSSTNPLARPDPRSNILRLPRDLHPNRLLRPLHPALQPHPPHPHLRPLHPLRPPNRDLHRPRPRSPLPLRLLRQQPFRLGRR